MCIVQKVVHPFSECVKSVRSRCASLTHTGSTGVWVWRRKLRKYVSLEHPNGMKLEKSQVQWIVKEKKKGELTNAQIAGTMDVTVRWVQKLWARHKGCPAASEISHPAPMGRPQNGLPGRREHSAVMSARHAEHMGAAGLQQRIANQTGIHIPHGIIHKILRDEEMAEAQPSKGTRYRWVRYERDHSNSLWHTDWKQIHGGMHDGRWFLCYEDDASRFVTGYGIFDNATTKNALAVLETAIEKHGKPASIMTDHGSQFYANEKETAKKRGEGEFEKKLTELGIRQILAGVGRPQTNGKVERLHGEIQRKLHEFEEIMMRKSDPIDLFMQWYNHDRPHRSLDWDNQETPAQAFLRKMPKEGETVIDGQTGEEYDVK